MNVRTIPTQKWRAVLLFVYVAALVGVSKCVFGEWFPSPSGGKAVWFYTGLASLLLGNHLVTPYFSKPVDAVSYAIAASAALLGVENLLGWNTVEMAVFYGVLGYCVFVLLVSFLAIFTRNSAGSITARTSETATLLAGAFGNQRAVFGLTMMAAAYLFHRDSLVETYFISVVCIIFVVARPEEVLSGVLIRLCKVWAGALQASLFGELAAQQMPRLVLVRKNDDEHPRFASVLGIKAPGRKIFPALTLDVVGRDEATLVRALELTELGANASRAFETVFQGVPDNSIVDLPKGKLDIPHLDDIQKRYEQTFIGIVAHDTSTERLFIEIVAARNLYEGLLVAVDVQGEQVIYQLLDGLTKEEIVHQKNTLGFVRAQAKKVGIWDTEKKRFRLSKWLPNLNEPVFLAQSIDEPMAIDTIGRFPGSSYPVQLKDVNALVTHNTAILGILGVGKSMLAIELVERMMAQGIKVICLDLTDQYAIELDGYIDKDADEATMASILDKVDAASAAVQDNPEQGGSIPILEQELYEYLKDFLQPGSEQKLKIFNPARITATKQTTEPKSYQQAGQWKRSAPLWSVTPVEVTRIISQIVLKVVQEMGMSDAARVCLIYEEAHSLVPEWNSVAFDGDKAATAGTARAILQGRKYGMGCLLITQRTANVTKTILNQCNSIFAMRTFDDTGKDFLANYVGRDYADTLSSLPERHAVFFGRASSCENPVLIELNNRDEFKQSFRKKFPLPISDKTDLSQVDVAETDGHAIL